MDWTEVLEVETGDERIEETREALQQKNSERRRMNFDRKFRPGTVKRLKPLEKNNRFRTNLVESPRRPNVLGDILEAYMTTGYVEPVEGNSDNNRYTLNPEHRQDAFDFSQVKLAENAESMIQGLDQEAVCSDLSEYDVVSDSAEINGEKVIDAYRHIDYADDTLEYLNKLGLITDEKEVKGREEDFEVVTQVTRVTD